MDYWMNVDRIAQKCTLHTEDCKHIIKIKEKPWKGVDTLKQFGGWLKFKSIEKAKDYFIKEWEPLGYAFSLNCNCIRYNILKN